MLQTKPNALSSVLLSTVIIFIFLSGCVSTQVASFITDCEISTPNVEGPTVIRAMERVTILSESGNTSVCANIDTGAGGSSVHDQLVESLGLQLREETMTITSVNGVAKRKLVDVTFVIAGKKIITKATIADRSRLPTPVLIGVRDLIGFLIDPSVPSALEAEEED